MEELMYKADIIKNVYTKYKGLEVKSIDKVKKLLTKNIVDRRYKENPEEQYYEIPETAIRQNTDKQNEKPCRSRNK